MFSYRILTEKFASVTILFSDIVTFTNIAAAVQPIDIVNMLNDLYHKFDNCSEKNDVYKVVCADSRRTLLFEIESQLVEDPGFTRQRAQTYYLPNFFPKT